MLYLAPLAILSLSMPSLGGLRHPVTQLRTSILLKWQEPHCTCIFLRHGQSTWNEASLFTGWADVELTTRQERGRKRCDTALVGRVQDRRRIYFVAQTCPADADIVLQITGQEDVPVHCNWRLNERMYGGLTGLNKKETVEKYGADQVKIWRRSYDTPPPPIDTDSKYWPGNDNSYAHIPADDIPLSECLKDTVERTVPYWDRSITPALKRGKTVLVAAHGNSIRGMLKHLDDISDEEIVDIEIRRASCSCTSSMQTSSQLSNQTLSRHFQAPSLAMQARSKRPGSKWLSSPRCGPERWSRRSRFNSCALGVAA